MITTVVASIGLILTMLASGIYSNIEFSFLLLFGISGLHILAVLNVSEPSNLLCNASTFWRYFALDLYVTVLFTKTTRITRVFRVDKVA